jgi:hypothetical protein
MELINSLHYRRKSKVKHENVQVREREASCKEGRLRYVFLLCSLTF